MRHRRRTLANVSVHWRMVVSGTPSLWTDLRSDQADVGVALSRSGQAGLRVACRPVSGGHYIPHARRFWSHIGGHSERWEEVWFEVREGARAVVRSLERPTPKLRVLSVAFEADVFTRRKIILQPGPPLQHLNLERTRLIWANSRLSNLQSLELCRLIGGLPSMDRLREILKESPRLERLALLELRAGPEGYHGNVPSTIELPNLTSLFIADVPTAMMDCLLGSIRTTHLRSVILHHVGWHHVPTDHQGSALSLLIPSVLEAQNLLSLTERSFREVALGTESLDMGEWAGGWQRPWPYRRETDTTPFHITFEVPNYVTGMVGVARFLHSLSPTVPVILRPKCSSWTDGPTNGPAEVFPLELLHELPELYGISITSRAQAIGILNHLVTSEVDDEGVHQYPCPQLVSLDLSRVSDVYEALEGLKMVREVANITLPEWSL